MTILGSLVIVVVVLAVILSTPAASQFTMVIHIYDSPNTYTSVEQLPLSELVPNVTITVSGPKNFGGPPPSPTGILNQGDIPGGTYTIQAEKTGYQPVSISYALGPSCLGKDQTGVCHALVRIRKNP